MAVAQFSEEQSLLQKVLATSGQSTASALKQERERNAGIISDRGQEINDAALRKMTDRDKKRMKSDQSFQPQDSDFNAPRTFEFYTNVDYYQTLGVDEYATQDEIKKAYRKLSLAYHPDKTNDADTQQKEEFAAIFIEVKNAYRLLADNPTRRQYDYHRDRNMAKGEISGRKVDDVPSFNAHEALRRLEEMAAAKARLPSEVKYVTVHCKLEKFVNGGHKAVWHERMIRERGTIPAQFVPIKRLFRLDIPTKSKVPVIVEFQKAGDQHEGQDRDDLHFVVQPKPHKVLQVVDDSLFVKEPVNLTWRDNSIFMAEVQTIRGQIVFVLGRNPYASVHASDSTKQGTLNVSLSGLGLGAAGKLCLTIRFALGSPDLGKRRTEVKQHKSRNSGSTRSDAKQFLLDFGLGPPSGFAEAPKVTDMADLDKDAAFRQRRPNTRAHDLSQDAYLEPIGEPVHLYTKPPCIATFFSNSREISSSSIPRVFAVCLSSSTCAKKKGAAAWQRMRVHLLPVLRHTGFLLIRGTQDLKPRALLHSAPMCRMFSPQDTADGKFSAPWKLLGDGAFRAGDYWHAAACYSKFLQFVADDDSDINKAKVFSNRAACYAKLNDFEASLVDARRAAELHPSWSRAWSRVGWASWKLGGTSYLQEALDAFSLAVQLDASGSNVDSLYAVAQACGQPDAEEAHRVKEQGTESLNLQECGKAIAAYTKALAKLPCACSGSDDEHALLRSVLYMNRSIAFTWLRCWNSAVADGRKAVDAKADFARARVQIGVALLASGFPEQAYSEFARALAFDHGNSMAEKGRKACLLELQLWRSVPSRIRRRTRFAMDRPRPMGSVRVFAISDIHYDQKDNENWVWAIDDFAFQDDVLIVPGNVADTHGGIVRALTALKSKFRRVFYTPGNHEMWLGNSEVTRFPDSFAKFLAIIETCDSLGIDMAPAYVSQGLAVVPLLSWYNADFDEKDPFPSVRGGRVDARCKWPMDADEQLWKYMLRLNEERLRCCENATILTFAHFLPRRELPFSRETKTSAKTVGCEELDKQIRKARSQLHVFGHSCQNYISSHAGIKYVQNALGPTRNRSKETDDIPPLMLVHNGLNVCMQEWNIQGKFAKHLLCLLAYALPNLRPGSDEAASVKKASRALQGHNGLHSSFHAVGSRKLDKSSLAEKIWPDLQKLSCNTTHVLVAVAENEDALKKVLQSDAEKTWRSSLTPYVQDITAIHIPLGLDFVPHEVLSGKQKEDAMLVVWCLKLKTSVSEDSKAYAGMQAAVAAINRLPGVAGKIAADVQRAGFGIKTHSEVVAALGTQDNSKGITHCFMVVVDEPESFKLLIQSKTYARWKTAVEPYFADDPTPQIAFCVPLQISVRSRVPIDIREED